MESKEHSEDAKYHWEMFRENIRPIRSGRDVKKINEIFSAPSISLDTAKEKFEDVIVGSANITDPLACFVAYVDWFQQHFPSGKCTYMTEILSRTIDIIGHLKEYSDDERLMKLWFKLSEYSKEPDLILGRAYNTGCCHKLARFYIRWSEVYENMGNFNVARRILDDGRRKGAMPLNLLNDATDKFECRHFRSKLTKNIEEDQINSDFSRIALGCLTETDGTLPVIRTSSLEMKGLSFANPAGKRKSGIIFEVQKDLNQAEADENVNDIARPKPSYDLARVKLTENDGNRSNWNAAQIISSVKFEKRPINFKVLDEEEDKEKKKKPVCLLAIKNEVISPEECLAELLGYKI